MYVTVYFVCARARVCVCRAAAPCSHVKFKRVSTCAKDVTTLAEVVALFKAGEFKRCRKRPE